MAQHLLSDGHAVNKSAVGALEVAKNIAFCRLFDPGMLTGNTN